MCSVDAVLFTDLCAALAKIRKIRIEKGSTEKSKELQRMTFQKFYKNCETKCGSNERFPEVFAEQILPLIISTQHKWKFDMGATKLAQKVRKLLASTAKKTPSSKSDSEAVDDLVEEVHSLINLTDFDCLTIKDISERLERISSKTTDSDADLEHLLHYCSKEEIVWIFNIIIRNVESYMNISYDTVLGWISPDAKARFDATRDLSSVVGADDDNEDGDDLTVPKLGRNFKPMLLALPDRNDWYAPIKANGGENFFMQTKYDGEHVLLHRIGGKSYKWFTRNGKDFTEYYGSSSSDIDKLSGRIDPFFYDDVDDCILDCELMIYDKVLKKLCRHQFASANSDQTSHSFRHIKPEANVQLAVVVFDLLIYKKRKLHAATLEDRLKVLEKGVFKELRDDTIFIAPVEVGNSKEDVQRFFEIAMRQQDEGIVVKRRDSFYCIGKRVAANGWFKLKPSLTYNELDLAIVAIVPEQGKEKKTAYQLAARDGDSGNYRTVTYCSTGLSHIERSKIYENATIAGPLLKEAPDILTGWKIDHPRGGFIRPENWVVVEITSNGLRDGKLMDAVMRRTRSDEKDIDEVDTLQHFRAHEETLKHSSLPDEAKQGVNTKIKRVTKAALFAQCELNVETKRSKVEVNPLMGVRICVLQGTDEKTRKKAIQIATNFGAKPVMNPDASTQLIIAVTEKHPKTKVQIQAGRVNVIRADWLMRCEELKQIVPWEDGEIINAVDGAFNISTADDE